MLLPNFEVHWDLAAPPDLEDLQGLVVHWGPLALVLPVVQDDHAALQHRAGLPDLLVPQGRMVPELLGLREVLAGLAPPVSAAAVAAVAEAEEGSAAGTTTSSAAPLRPLCPSSPNRRPPPLPARAIRPYDERCHAEPTVGRGACAVKAPHSSARGRHS